MKVKMEYALTVMSLGGLFAISRKKPKCEPFVGNYTNANQQTDVHYAPKKVPERYLEDMAGRRVKASEFVSENMIPFFGKTKAIGPEIGSDAADTKMDMYTGAGSMQTNKVEMAPLFKPENNTQLNYGAPNQTDFYRSRVNTSMYNNVSPFEAERVAPGLNKGFTGSTAGGYNSGMEARETWLDKTVDQLRIDTKPKVSFNLDGHQGPPLSAIKNLGIEGETQKKLPDKFYVNTPDRYMTTVVNESPALRALQPDPTIHRATTSKAYAGPAGNGVQSQPQKGLARLDHRQQLAGPSVPPAQGIAQRNGAAAQKAYTMYGNNRTTTDPLPYGGAQSLISAIAAPLTDMLRPTRKENVLGAKRIGNPSGSVRPPVVNDTVPTTVKETTVYSPYAAGSRPHLPSTDGYQNTAIVLPETNRATSVSYAGAGSSMFPEPTVRNQNGAVYSNRGVTMEREPNGNTNMFNNEIHLTKTADRDNVTSYTGMPTSLLTTPTVNFNETRPLQQYEQYDRNTADLLDAFRKNPYTQSLSSVA
jgi:hypothetical protein